ncbi:hypothetical protein [Endozoicomonas sp. SESOKO1]|uniref:hypothetical protein n=1 Tax=Endozoicomonas sp. SESOKO1 TaxID=2828742 RepID=UPI0021476A66|nr:hypothetical protein [Endozoicomonas sp. SESOKO1]
MRNSTLRAMRKLAAMQLETHKFFSPYTMQVFCLVAEAGDAGISQVAILERIDMSKSTAGKTTRMLSARQSGTKEGLDLCEWVEDPTDLRTKYLRLNARGKILIEAMSNLFER